jgi:hypothetical protein
MAEWKFRLNCVNRILFPIAGVDCDEKLGPFKGKAIPMRRDHALKDKRMSTAAACRNPGQGNI